MTRRELLRLLVAAGATLSCSPVWAASSDELATRAQDLLTSGQPDRALPILLEALGKDARNDRVHALLGRVYYQQGDPVRAVEHFSMAVRLNPEDTLSRMMEETLRQFPLPREKVAAGAGGGPRRVSALAREAEAERRALLAEQGRRSAEPFRLLLDPGHGGTDSGALGAGLREADVALDLSLRLARLLAAAKAEIVVSLTRTADVTLPVWARAGLSGYYGADLLLSVHATRVADSRAAGVALYTYAPVPGDALAGETSQAENRARASGMSLFGKGESELFAAAVRQAAGVATQRRATTLAQALAKALPAGSPLPVRGNGVGPFRLLAEAATPAILVEAGFLSHPDDAATLAVADKRQALAQTLASAVLAAARG